jgi:hypothetical protein
MSTSESITSMFSRLQRAVPPEEKDALFNVLGQARDAIIRMKEQEHPTNGIQPYYNHLLELSQNRPNADENSPNQAGCAAFSLAGIFGPDKIPVDHPLELRRLDLFAELVYKLAAENNAVIIQPTSSSQTAELLYHPDTFGALFVTEEGSHVFAAAALTAEQDLSDPENPRGKSLTDWKQLFGKQPVPRIVSGLVTYDTQPPPQLRKPLPPPLTAVGGNEAAYQSAEELYPRAGIHYATGDRTCMALVNSDSPEIEGLPRFGDPLPKPWLQPEPSKAPPTPYDCGLHPDDDIRYEAIQRSHQKSGWGIKLQQRLNSLHNNQ